MFRRSTKPKYIIVVRRPIGDAPEWVKDAWIGVRLPVAKTQATSHAGFSVTKGPHTLIPRLWSILRKKSDYYSGYVVHAKTSVEILSETRPDAANWWRTNVHNCLQGFNCFLFDEESCEIFIDD